MENVFNKSKFATRLKELMEDYGDTIYSLAQYVDLSPSSISKYTNASMAPKTLFIEKVSRKYNVNPVWLMGADIPKQMEDYGPPKKKVPILGTIAAGKPIWVNEDVEGYEIVNNSDGYDFCLTVRGDSMIGARIMDGDIVYISQQENVDNGDIAAVLIDDETTLKRVYKLNGHLILRAENPRYQDIIYSEKDHRNIKIIGKAKAFKSNIR